VHAAPAVSCANAHKERAHEHTGSAETLRPSLRNGFTAYNELSPVNGSFATVIPKKLASQELDASTAASGPHDFAVRLSHTRQLQLSRPSHLTARSWRWPTPLIRRETGGVMRLIWVRTKADFFWFRALTWFRKIRTDLPVVPVCRRPLREIALVREANQLALRDDL